jgi:hypothetical protein
MAKKSSGGFPGIPTLGTLSTMLDSVDFVKKAWSTFNLPTSFAPTMDVEELDKRIADLKAVEQWLNVNLSMLRGTIQGLEIQRGTLAAVKAFGKAVVPETGGKAQAAREVPNYFPTPPMAEPAPEPEPQAPAPAPRKAKAAKAGKASLSGAASLPGALAGAASQVVNPGAWWNLLQSQFNQVAQAAMSGSGLSEKAPKAALATRAGAKGKAKVAVSPEAAKGATKRAGKSAARATSTAAAKRRTRATSGR